MKTAFIFTVFLWLMNNLQSQVISSSDSMPVAGKLNYSLFENGEIINKTNKGIIYALPQDGMPVLRPDTSMAYHMPIYTFKNFPFRLSNIKPQINTNREKNSWKDSLIQTPNGPHIIFKPIKPLKLILPNRQ